MAVRTYVATTVLNERLEEVVHALESMDPSAVVPSVNRSNDPGLPAGVSVALPGDVREAVREQLKAFPDLEYELYVRDTDDREPGTAPRLPSHQTGRMPLGPRPGLSLAARDRSDPHRVRPSP